MFVNLKPSCSSRLTSFLELHVPFQSAMKHNFKLNSLSGLFLGVWGETSGVPNLKILWVGSR